MKFRERATPTADAQPPTKRPPSSVVKLEYREAVDIAEARKVGVAQSRRGACAAREPQERNSNAQ